MNQDEATALVGLLSTAFPSARFGAENAAIYERSLLDLEAAEAQHAIGELIHSSRYLPTIAEIRGEVTRARRDAVSRSESASRLRLGSGAGRSLGPSPAAWGAALGNMLEASVKHQAMARAWYAARGKVTPPDPGMEFVELAQSGARGENVTERIRRAVNLPPDDSERRFP